jgi:ketosteroid isomerase-like protein
MSQDDLAVKALAEAAFGALNSRDLEAFMAVSAEDVEFTSMVAEMEGTTFRGHDGIRQWWATVVEAFDDVRWTILDIRGASDRAVGHVRMDGTLGEVPVKLSMWLAASMRDGKVTRWSWHRTEPEAIEAAGLGDDSR